MFCSSKSYVPENTVDLHTGVLRVRVGRWRSGRAHVAPFPPMQTSERVDFRSLPTHPLVAASGKRYVCG